MKKLYMLYLTLVIGVCNSFLVAEEYIPIVMDDITVIVVNKKVTENITYNGIRYGVVISPYTGKVWLDRNLGASRVCKSFNDSACYGDYYQWGRYHDGHQYPKSLTTNIKASNVNGVGSNFITVDDTMEFDWTEIADPEGSLRSINWSKTDGSSICPVGFRAPAVDELKRETIDQGVNNIQTAFLNFLKLPLSGYREGHTGTFYSRGDWGFLWTGSIYAFGASEVVFGDSAFTELQFRSFGLPVRCIKD